MTTTRIRTTLQVLSSALVVGVACAGQVTFRVVASLNQLQQPIGITEGSAGVFYSAGGSNQSVFSVTASGAVTVLTTFPSGHNLTSPVISAANTRFYSAVVYHLNPTNVFSVSSAVGSKQLYPASSLSPGFTENLPDGTLLAGAIDSSSVWHLAKSDLKGSITSLYTFPSGETLPYAAIYASDGNYYGLSIAQNSYIYRLTPSGVLTKVVNFAPNAVALDLYTPLLEASDGALYGTIPAGINRPATFYKLTLSGQYTVLYTFPQGLNYSTTSMVEGSDGNFYGSTSGVGSQLIQLTKAGKYTVLYTMNPNTDGYCQCLLTQGSDGNIYGTAQYGGNSGGGTIFALNAALPKPAPRALRFNPKSGAVGTKVLIWGTNLLSSAVSFNGVPATTVTGSGPNYVTATVPTGATTGPITIITPGGTYTTRASFTVQ